MLGFGWGCLSSLSNLASHKCAMHIVFIHILSLILILYTIIVCVTHLFWEFLPFAGIKFAILLTHNDEAGAEDMKQAADTQ